ncbi:MAG: Hsp20/alpha crystallin family protein [Peptococcaceae bacterium]|nr:Hsp20/alpha crystallin family protein [Peptococcaceae bacterium]
MLPRLFGENLFDDFFGDDMMMRPFREAHPGKKMAQMMKTDVRETDNTYELTVDLPGFDKNDINIDLKNETLTITATHNEDKSEKNDEGKFIRQERYTGSYSRGFYVGDVKPEDIGAKYENGTLKLSIPKADKAVPAPSSRIAIE